MFLYFNSNLSSFTTLRGKKTQKFEFLLQFSPFMFINTFTKECEVDAPQGTGTCRININRYTFEWGDRVASLLKQHQDLIFVRVLGIKRE